MKAFFALCRISFQGLLLNSSQHTKAGKKAARGFGILALIALFCLYISGVYSFLLAGAFAKAGCLDLLYVLMCTAGTAASFLFCLFNAAGFVFGGKDTDFLLSLPVPDTTLVLSRVVALYLENLFFSVCFLLPAAAAVLVNGGAFSLAILLCVIFICLLLPLLSSTAALVLAYFVSLFENRGRHRVLIRTILNFALFGVVMVFALRSNLALAGLMESPDAMRAGFERYLFVFSYAARAMYAGSFYPLALFAAWCIVPFALVTALLSRSYRPLVAKLSASTVHSNYRLGGQSSQSAFSALYKREISRYVSSTVYLMNTSIGMLLLLGGCVFLLIRRQAVMSFLPTLGGQLLPIAALCIGFTAAISCVTGPSISLEGNRLWILKTAPLDPRTIFDAKLAVHLTVCVPALIVSGILVGISGIFTWTESLLLILLGCAISFLIGELGLLCNLQFPKLDASNDTVVVKQSASVLAAMLAGAIICAIGVGLFRLLSPVLSPMLTLWLVLLLLIVGSFVSRRVLFTRGVRRFAALI